MYLPSPKLKLKKNSGQRMILWLQIPWKEKGEEIKKKEIIKVDIEL